MGGQTHEGYNQIQAPQKVDDLNLESVGHDPDAALLVVKSALILGRTHNEYVISILKRSASFLLEAGVRVFLPDSESTNLVAQKDTQIFTAESKVDVVITIGGDGSVLGASRFFSSRSVPPVLSFNVGTLGFLTTFNPERCEEILAQLIKAEGINVRYTIRQRLEVVLEQFGETKTHTALNEVFVQRNTKAMCELDILLGDEIISRVRGDGLLVATSTGSTAYSLAAGGPMVSPLLDAIVLTHVCPHTLSARPMVLPPTTVRLKVRESCRENPFLIIDGEFVDNLDLKSNITIRKSTAPIKCIAAATPALDWMNSINRSFYWNLRNQRE